MRICVTDISLQNLGTENFSVFAVQNMGNRSDTPTPTYKAKIQTKIWSPELSSLPCFEAFGVIFCTDFCSYFCLVCGGGMGHSSISENTQERPKVKICWPTLEMFESLS